MGIRWAGSLLVCFEKAIKTTLGLSLKFKTLHVINGS